MAQLAFREHRHDDAFRNLFAEYLTNDADAVENYEKMGWVPALKRPMLAVRWGVGVEYNSGNYEGDAHPIGTGMQTAANTGRGGRGGPGGSGAMRPSGPPGSGGPGFPGMSPYGPQAGGAASGDVIARTTGEVGQKVIERLTTRIADGGVFGEVLKEMASEAPPAQQPGAAGFAGGPGGSYPSGPGAGPGGSYPSGPGAGPGGSYPSGPGVGPGGSYPSGPGVGPSSGSSYPTGPGAGPGSSYPTGPGAGPSAAPGSFPGAPGAPGSFTGAPGSQPRAATRDPDDPQQLAPGLVMLGQDDKEELLEKAKKHELDVLLVFDVQVQENKRTGIVKNTTKIFLYNVASGEMFDDAAVRSLINVDVERAREKGVDDDPVDQVLEKLFTFIDEQLVISDMPEAITPEQTVPHVERLSQSGDDRLLQKLNEVRFYRSRGLIDNEQLEAAYVALAGEEVGSQLATGKSSQKKEAVEKLID